MGPALDLCWRVYGGAGLLFMLLFVAAGLELRGAELTFEVPALMHLFLMFIVCLKAVIYFSAGGAWHHLWWARGLGLFGFSAGDRPSVGRPF